MWVRFLQDVPLIDAPLYRDLMANRPPDSLDGLVELAVWSVLQQACSTVERELLGYDVGQLARRAGLTVQQVRGAVGSLATRGVVELGGGENPTETRHPVAMDVVGDWNLRVEQNNRLAGRPKLARVSRLTGERRRKIAARLLEPHWLDAFHHALRMVPLEPRPGFAWNPTLDWVITNGTNVFKLAEGQYSAR